VFLQTLPTQVCELEQHSTAGPLHLSAPPGQMSTHCTVGVLWHAWVVVEQQVELTQQNSPS
jgi:hypothetical protein